MAGPGGLAAGLAALGAVENFFPSVGREHAYGGNTMWPNLLPTLGDMLVMYNRELIGLPDLAKYGAMLGFSPAWTARLLKSSKQLPSLMDAIVMYRRGIINKERFDKLVHATGWESSVIDEMLDVTKYFPGVQELIRFAVRDVYTPATVDEYQLLLDLPPKLLEECKKIGMPEDQAKNFWGSHWELPSLGAVAEMLHRRVKKPDGEQFTSEDFATFLRVNDYSPYWRGMIEQISYNPLTRVDVRRMYELGVVDKQKVHDNYLDLGYTEENAELMTEFTTVHDSPDTVGFTRSTLTDAYVKGAITFEELEMLFKEIGIIGKASAYWLEIAQYNKTEAEVTKIITRYTEAYLTGSRDIDSIRADLNQADLPAHYIDKILADMLADKLSKRKVPPVDTLIDWLESHTIDDSQFHGRMRLLGYSDEDILLYMTKILKKTGSLRRVYLKKEDYLGFFAAGIMIEQDLRTVLGDMGISREDVDFLIAAARSKQVETIK